MQRFSGTSAPTNIPVLVIAGLLATLGALRTACAADAPPFGVLVQQSLPRAPILLEQQAGAAAARFDAAQSRAWLNPRVDVFAEDLGAPMSEGRSQRQTTYSINQPLEIGGKRAARIALADQQSASAEARQQSAEVEWTARLAVAYAAVEAAQARLRIAGEERDRATDDLRAARAQVEAGKEAALRVAQAEAGVAAARGSEQAASAEVTEALEDLTALAGVQDRFTGVAGTLLALDGGGTGGGNADGNEAGDPPSLRLARAEREASEAGAQVEERRWIPDLNLTAGVRRYAWSSQNGYVVGVSASIPLFDRNRDAVAAARQRVEAAAARLAATRLDVTAARRSAQARSQATDGQLAAALEGERASTEAYRLGRIGYDAGKTSLVELLLVRRSWSEARRATVDARFARIRALAALAQAEGRLAFGEAR